jgi:hypothetical protein
MKSGVVCFFLRKDKVEWCQRDFVAFVQAEGRVAKHGRVKRTS